MPIEGINPSQLSRYPLEGSIIHVIDGDTIELHKGSEKVTIRLAGIDAPETAKGGKGGQAGSGGAIAYLQAIITNYPGQIQLYIVPGESTYNRLVGVLVVGNLNVNLAMARRGLVLAYSPEGGIPGVSTGKFKSAEKKALQDKQGIFALEEYRAMVALNATKAVTNVRLSDEERLAQDYQARIRVGAIKALRSSMHQENVPQGIQGMKPGRPDFPGGRAPGNVHSMALLKSSEIAGVLGSDFGAWQQAVNYLQKSARGSIQFADVETTGLAASEFVTEAAVVRVVPSGVAARNYAIHPALPGTGEVGSVMKGLNVGYDTELDDAFRKSLFRSGSRNTRIINDPDLAGFFSASLGDEFDMGHVKKLLARSNMPEKFKTVQLQHIQGLRDQGRLAELGDVVRGLFDVDPGWLFLHNTRFEANRFAPALGDVEYDQLLQSGKLAGGSLGYKSIAQSFDPELSRLSSEAFGFERVGDYASASRHRVDWYRRFQGLFDGSIRSPRGLKTVDIMDLARSTFALAGRIDPTLAGSTQGLLSQDFLGGLFGLASESHVAIKDTLQSQIIVARLLEINKGFLGAIDTGSNLAPGLDLIRKARAAQPTLALFGIMNDLSNKIARGDTKVLVKTDKLTELSDRGRYMIGGEKAPMPTIRYAATIEGQIEIAEYTKRRVKASIAGLSEEETTNIANNLLDFVNTNKGSLKNIQPGTLAREFFSGLGGVDPATMVGASPMTRLGLEVGMGAQVTPSEHLEALRARLMQSPAEPTTTTRKASAKAASKLADMSKLVGEYWKDLPVTHKRGVQVAGAAMVALGVAGMIRGVFEDEQPAQPTSFDYEQYAATQQAIKAIPGLALNEMLAEANDMSSQLLNMQKSPGRYYNR